MNTYIIAPILQITQLEHRDVKYTGLHCQKVIELE